MASCLYCGVDTRVIGTPCASRDASKKCTKCPQAPVPNDVTLYDPAITDACFRISTIEYAIRCAITAFTLLAEQPAILANLRNERAALIAWVQAEIRKPKPKVPV